MEILLVFDPAPQEPKMTIPLLIRSANATDFPYGVRNTAVEI
jgi:hypothetical protein